MSAYSHRSLLSPFIVITFTGVSITGILLLFTIKGSALFSIHQWSGLLFTAAGVLHLRLNWKVFKTYFKNRKATMGLLAGTVALILIAMAFPSTSHDYGNHRSGAGRGHYGGAYNR